MSEYRKSEPNAASCAFASCIYIYIYVYIYVSLHTCCVVKTASCFAVCRLSISATQVDELPIGEPSTGFSLPGCQASGTSQGPARWTLPTLRVGESLAPPPKRKKHRTRIRIAHIQVGLRNKSGIVRLKKESPQFQFHVQAARREPVARLCRPSIDAWGERATSINLSLSSQRPAGLLNCTALLSSAGFAGTMSELSRSISSRLIPIKSLREVFVDIITPFGATTTKTIQAGSTGCAKSKADTGASESDSLT